ncbi:MAG TPA: hypothetical protein VH186_12235 [Chloroflexia bacterium]|nr:hypothetical protein [Chloroflexia bacterium]
MVAKSVAKVGQLINSKIKSWTKPGVSSRLAEAATDLLRPRVELIAENAFLRQQLTVLNRQIDKPAFTSFDRFFLVLLAGWVRHWKINRSCAG